MDKKRIRILLADDHEILREGLRSLLEKQPDMEVVADVGDGRTAIRQARELQPDVIVMDIGMPDLNGIEATRLISAEGSHCRVICLSVHRERRLVTAMLQAGASGYLLKTTAAKELVDAVRAVAAGQAYLSPSIAQDVVQHHVRAMASNGAGAFSTLSEREREVLQLIAEGYQSKEIAERLHVSPKTVLAHRESLMKKLKLDSTVALARYALREGIAEL
ncbi:MAG: response regulator transcription factor [Planctomycetota bacterium]